MDLEHDIAGEVVGSDDLTDYDLAHLTTYLRLLDAEEEGADWKDAARTILGLRPQEDEAGSRRCWETHLGRARWMTHTGYKLLLARGRRPAGDS
ncbi:DUF2285 domain-containing protein [Caulobacter sp. 602-2]|uniref:DUF2285 domain-containing protein n=1 Tax=Caulobacter sp. 602-2 TaxID=2710887 RepID=A0A6G4QV68_9CAUL|nr:DUF2285 domain-containing protein [Caulobacter sp. 602-2]NGM49383.1 DUF2285 domain-containing protein [Caulobacter sp. 602-2]